MERRDSAEIVNSIATVLEKNSGRAISVTAIAKETKLNYNSAVDYIELIRFIKHKLPDIEEIKTHKGRIFMIKRMSEYPLEEQKEILREEFGIKMDNSDKLYMSLIKEGAISPENAIRLPLGNGIIKEGLKLGHLKKGKQGRIYLTKIGRMIAEGAVELFGRG
ncbi:MAG: hypothetical protein ABH854_01470 [Candidatus Diapherotrites archaeon]